MKICEKFCTKLEMPVTYHFLFGTSNTEEVQYSDVTAVVNCEIVLLFVGLLAFYNYPFFEDWTITDPVGDCCCFSVIYTSYFTVCKLTYKNMPSASKPTIKAKGQPLSINLLVDALSFR